MKNYSPLVITGILCVGITLLISYWLWGSHVQKTGSAQAAFGLTAAAHLGRDAVVFVYTLSSDTSKERGSGVIISDDGYIVTNYHVISGGYTINVQLNNNHEY